MELENQLDNSGHLQAVQAMLRLEEEKGVPCTKPLMLVKSHSTAPQSWKRSGRLRTETG